VQNKIKIFGAFLIGGILSGLISWQIAASRHYEKGKVDGEIEATILHSWSYKLNTLLAEQGEFARIEKSNRDMMYSTVLIFDEWSALPGVSEENRDGLNAYITDIAHHFAENSELFISASKNTLFQEQLEDETSRIREILTERLAQQGGDLNSESLRSSP